MAIIQIQRSDSESSQPLTRNLSFMPSFYEGKGYVFSAIDFQRLPNSLNQPAGAILYPRYPLSISTVLKSIKLRSTLAINTGRKEVGEVWQARFYEHALRTVW